MDTILSNICTPLTHSFRFCLFYTDYRLLVVPDYRIIRYNVFVLQTISRKMMQALLPHYDILINHQNVMRIPQALLSLDTS